MWSICRECFDGADGDDFRYSTRHIKYWRYAPYLPIPSPPKEGSSNLNLVHGTVVPDAILTVSGSEEEKVIKGFTVGDRRAYTIDEVRGKKIGIKCDTEDEHNRIKAFYWVIRI